MGTILSVLLPLVICACRQTPGRGGYEAGYIEPLPPLGIPRTCHVLMDLEDFLMVKYKYLEEEGDELPDF